MARFLVKWHEVVWRSAEVEAKDEEEAWDKAQDAVDPDPYFQEIECQLDDVVKLTDMEE